MRLYAKTVRAALVLFMFVVACPMSVARADFLTKQDALLLGFKIVRDAACGKRSAALEVATFVNRGAGLRDFEPLKSEILQGKKIARMSLAQQSTRDFCSEPNTNHDYPSNSELLGFVSVSDQLCGTQRYEALVKSLKRKGKFYPRIVEDYAEEFAKGKRLQLDAFSRERPCFVETGAAGTEKTPTSNGSCALSEFMRNNHH